MQIWQCLHLYVLIFYKHTYVCTHAWMHETTTIPAYFAWHTVPGLLESILHWCWKWRRSIIRIIDQRLVRYPTMVWIINLDGYEHQSTCTVQFQPDMFTSTPKPTNDIMKPHFKRRRCFANFPATSSDRWPSWPRMPRKASAGAVTHVGWRWKAKDPW